ncbi:uncharacterized protein LOC143891702 [Tasmannia lanceolata]|uniref:uncharacterized protein LOC143891702 n=1 Tax=Tasmannia lanceolata TaxID=3420 RepID=UPI004062F56B
MRQRKWLELLKEYDCTIHYHSGKANVVADALSRKSSGTLATMLTTQKHLLQDLRKLGKEIVEPRAKGYIAQLVAQPSLLEKMKATQVDDPELQGKIEAVRKGKLPEFTVDKDDILSSTQDYQLAKLYIKEVVRLHGVPASIVSDHDPRFTSNFWRSIQKRWWTKLNFSTAFHPQIDGQSERTIQTLEDMLSLRNRLPSYHSSIQSAPYEALYGKRCRTPTCGDEVGERKLLSSELVQETTDKEGKRKVVDGGDGVGGGRDLGGGREIDGCEVKDDGENGFEWRLVGKGLDLEDMFEKIGLNEKGFERIVDAGFRRNDRRG